MRQRGAEARRMRAARQRAVCESRAGSPSRRRASRCGSARRGRRRATTRGAPRTARRRQEIEMTGSCSTRCDDSTMRRRIIGWRDCRLSRFSVGSGETKLRSPLYEEVLVPMAPKTLRDSRSRPCCCCWPSLPRTRFAAGRASSRAAITRTKSCGFAASPRRCRRGSRSAAYVSRLRARLSRRRGRGRDRRVDLQLRPAPAHAGRAARERLRRRYQAPRLRLLAAISARSARSSGTCSIS